MKRPPEGVLGVFEHLDAAVDAVRTLKAQKVGKISVTSPVPHHELEHALDEGPSPVRWFVLLGGATGTITAFVLTIWTAYHWGLVVGGKAMASLPPYCIIAFELTVLFGSLMNFLSMIGLGGMPAWGLNEPYDPRFTEDRIGIWVPCTGNQIARVADSMRTAGAEEVHVEGR
jgi:molybdopterin-containing oxidoreductase family membrane subunit